MNDRDVTIFKKIVSYCERIGKQVDGLGEGFETFSNGLYEKDAILMNILQIGELVGLLSEEVTEKHTAIPWKQIKSVRNRAVHGYETISLLRAWQIATTDISQLKAYCESILEGTMPKRT